MLFGCAEATFYQVFLVDFIVFQLSKIGKRVTKNFSDIILAKSNLAKIY